MKRLFLPIVFLAAAFCREQPPESTVAVDTREPVAVKYVGAPELPVHERPDASSPVVSTYQNGEAISILSERGEWVEIRTGESSGWARAADLTTAEAKVDQEENPQPRFRIMPLPVSAPGASGEVYLEADVNSDGDVVSVRTITNTTGSDALAEQNTAALRAAKFHPIVIQGVRTPFKYYHRVTY